MHSSSRTLYPSIFLISACVAASAGLYAPRSAAAAAQAEDDLSTIEQVIVTARRREERLQETPVAITAFSEEALTVRNITNLAEIAPYTPGLTFDAGTGNTGGAFNAQVWMRGVGQSDFLFTTDPGVGIYVDGVYHARQLGAVVDLLELERVEVLRGPQGTLYGKNTTGGAIQLISRRPSEAFGGNVEVTAGRYDRLDVKGSVDLPLADGQLLTRMSYAFANRDGYVSRKLDEDNQGDIDSRAARLMANWIASDTVDVMLIGDITRKRQSSIANFAIDANAAAPFAAIWNIATGNDYGPDSITGGMFSTNATGSNSSDLDDWGISATVNWDIAGDLSLKSITAYRKTEAYFGGDQDNSALDFLQTTNDNEHDQLSQEFLLSGTAFDDRLDWVSGVYYLKEDGSDTFDAGLGIGMYAGLEALPGPIPGTPFGGAGNPANASLDLDTLRNTEIDIESFSVYGQGTYHVTDRLSATVGVRYTDESKDFEATVLRNSTGTYTIAPGEAQPSDGWTEWTPRGGLEYRFTDDVMSYFSVAKGFKSGGFNGRPSALAVAVETFDPEYVTQYELGMKSTWFDDRLLVNTAAYFSDYTDIQFTAICLDCGSLIVIVDNAGEAEIKGVELEMLAQLSPNLAVNGVVSYIDAEYTELNAGVQGITLDSKFPKTPEWTYSVGAQYTASLADGGSILVRSDWSYRSKTYHVVNNSPLLIQDGFGLLGARIAYVAPDESWEVALFGTNLTDEKYTTNGLESINFVGTADANPGRPREWGASVTYRFQ